MKDTDGPQGGGQLPSFRARVHDTEYVERQEKEERKRRRLSHPLSPVRLVIDLIDHLIFDRRR